MRLCLRTIIEPDDALHDLAQLSRQANRTSAAAIRTAFVFVACELNLKRLGEFARFASQNDCSGSLIGLRHRESVGRRELSNLLDICRIGAVVGCKLFTRDALAAGDKIVERRLFLAQL